MKTHYIAGNDHEGCGHSHKTIEAATKCLPLIDSHHGRKDVFKMVYRRGVFTSGIPMLVTPFITRKLVL